MPIAKIKIKMSMILHSFSLKYTCSRKKNWKMPFLTRKWHNLFSLVPRNFVVTFTTLNVFTISDKTVSVSCVARSSVELPCNLTSPLAEDQVRLVLWFKNDSAKPIYTYDTRGTTQYKINPKQSSHSLEQLQLTSSPWQDHGQNRGASYISYIFTILGQCSTSPNICDKYHNSFQDSPRLCPPLILLSKEQYCLAESSVPSMKQVGHWDSQG